MDVDLDSVEHEDCVDSDRTIDERPLTMHSDKDLWTNLMTRHLSLPMNKRMETNNRVMTSLVLLTLRLVEESYHQSLNRINSFSKRKKQTINAISSHTDRKIIPCLFSTVKTYVGLEFKAITETIRFWPLNRNSSNPFLIDPFLSKRKKHTGAVGM